MAEPQREHDDPQDREDEVGRYLGKALRLLRTQHGYNQTELCQRTGLSSSRMSRYESGHTIPSLPTVQRILEGLGVSFAELQDALDRVSPPESRIARKIRPAKGPVLMVAVAQEIPDARTAEMAAILASNLDPADKESTLWTDLAAIFQENRRREERQAEKVRRERERQEREREEGDDGEAGDEAKEVAG